MTTAVSVLPRVQYGTLSNGDQGGTTTTTATTTGTGGGTGAVITPTGPAVEDVGYDRSAIGDHDFINAYLAEHGGQAFDPLGLFGKRKKRYRNLPGEALAGATQFLDADYQSRFAPILQRFMAAQTGVQALNARLSRIKASTGKSFDAARGTSTRALQRYGLTQTSEAQAANERDDALSSTLATVQGMNATREAFNTEQTGNLQFLANLGRSGLQSSTDTLSALSGVATSRNNANMQADANAEAQNQQTAAAIASMALMFFCSRDVKDVHATVDGGRAMDLVNATPIYAFSYRPDAPPETRAHRGEVMLGPVIEETPGAMVSADGKHLNLFNAVGLLFAAVQSLSKQVADMQSQIEKGKRA